MYFMLLFHTLDLNPPDTENKLTIPYHYFRITKYQIYLVSIAQEVFTTCFLDFLAVSMEEEA